MLYSIPTKKKKNINYQVQIHSFDPNTNSVAQLALTTCRIT